MIHDLYTRPLEIDRNDGLGSVEIHRLGSDLLPRIGLVEWIELDPNSQFDHLTPTHEVWAFVSGSCSLWLRDTRAGSPTQSAEQTLEVTEPKLVLIPKDIKLGLSCQQPVRLLRMAAEAIPLRALRGS